MANRCEYVDPENNFPCGKNITLTKILIQYPYKKEPVIKYACKLHGDGRFRYLSSTEDKISSDYKQNKISYTEFSEKMKLIRWKNCRRCNGGFEKIDKQCCLEYYWLGDNRISLRRSFLLHDDCLESELKLFNVQKDRNSQNTSLDSVL